MPGQRRVTVEIGGDARGAAGAFDDAGGAAGRFGHAVGAVALGAAAGVAAIGVGLFALGSNFDDAFDTIRTSTGAMGDDLAGLQDDWRAVVASVPTDFGTAAEAISSLNSRLGLTGEPLQALSAQFIQLGNVTGGDLASQIEVGTRVLGDWQIAAADSAGALDMIFRASQQTGTGFDELSAAVDQFGPVFRGLGFTLDESLAIVGQFNATGVNTEQVLAGMQRGLTAMAREGEAPIETFERVSESIRNATSDIEAQQIAVDFFGRSGIGMAEAIRTGGFAIDDLAASIRTGGDTIVGAAEDTADFAEQWTLFKNQILLVLEPLAMAVFDGVGRAMTAIMPYAQRFMDWFQVQAPLAMAVLSQWWDQHGPQIVNAVRNTIAFVVTAFQRIRDVAEEVFPRIRHAVEVAVGWIRTTAVPWIQETVEAIRVRIDEMRAWWDEHWTQIQEAVGHVMVAIHAVIDTYLAVIVEIWERYGDNIMRQVRIVFEFVREFVSNVILAVKGIIETVMHLINGDWGLAWESFKQVPVAIFRQILNIVDTSLSLLRNIGGMAMESIVAMFDLAWEGIKNLVPAVFEAWFQFQRDLPGRLVRGMQEIVPAIGSWVIGTAVPAMADFGVRMGSGIIDGIVRGLRNLGGAAASFAGDAIQAVGSMARGIMNSIIDAMNNMIPNRIGAISVMGRQIFPGLDLPDNPIPHLALGGTATSSGWSVVGEAGPELMHLDRGASIVPLDRGLGGVTYNQTFNIKTTLSGPEVVALLRKHARSNGTLVLAP